MLKKYESLKHVIIAYTKLMSDYDDVSFNLTDSRVSWYWVKFIEKDGHNYPQTTYRYVLRDRINEGIHKYAEKIINNVK